MKRRPQEHQEHVRDEGVEDEVEEEEEVDDEVDAELMDEDVKEERAGGHQAVVPGVVYISYIPPRMRVKHVRHFLSVFGEMGRVFLQPEGESDILGLHYNEGFLILIKKGERRVGLGNVFLPTGKWRRGGGYLHRFHWCHLTERLTYERMVHRQRFRQEISQAKRETNFFAANVDHSKAIARAANKQRKEGGTVLEKTWTFKQKSTEDENLAKAREKINRIEEKTKSSRKLLTQIFGKPAV
uniref:Activator of basal transcription 1 n=1 Tax=Eptatretus burgeri TaxID=7764 RepID=A0A8C4X1R3_EPTBU